MKLLKCILLFSILGSLFFSSRPKGFHLSKITSTHAPDLRWEIAVTEKEKMQAEALLDQTFTYLGSGNRSYCFISEDERTVLKFFKQNRMKGKKNALHQNIREASFTSYQIAFEKLRDETRLIYPHLNPSLEKKRVTLIDQHGKKLTIPIYRFEFLLQEKATLGFEHLSACLEANRLDLASDAIDSLFKLVAQRCQKGIFDQDMRVDKNFGFIENKAVEIDVGEFKMYAQTPSQTKDQLHQLSLQIADWAHLHYPEHAPFLIEKMVQFESCLSTKPTPISTSF